ncbi:MAG: helix-turn-helix transcriptional regulator, partial [Proteobacteria bacterium]|nr:helix-turn-helix transcriptional regulator [Pseudomonadota bacterium]
CEQTIASAAKAVGCSAEAYERIELGERLPTLAELVRMHRVVRFNANIVLRRIDLELLDQDGT